VDIIIMVILMAVALLIWRGARRGYIIALWMVALFAMLGLFRFHITSHLDLSF
jgi:hypothetical protein